MTRDWKLEARRLLADVTGANDDAPRAAPQERPLIVFQAPVTVNVSVGHDRSAPEAQRAILQDRLSGFLAAEGPAFEEAFIGEVRRQFGKGHLADLDIQELGRLLAGFTSICQAARLLAATK